MHLIKQLDETDCGAACIAMIARFYKSSYPVTRIREIAGTDRQGTNLAGMVQAGNALGFSVQALKGDAQALTPQLPVPFIAHIKKSTPQGELLHFVVISRITAKKITVFDPAGEKKHISYADFLKEWTGYVLFFTPNEHFTVQKETVGLFARFLPLFRPYIGVVAQVLTASLLLTVFGILASLYFRSVIDDVVYTRALTSLTAFSIGILFLTLFQAIVTAIRSHLVLYFSLKIDFNLIFSYFKHVLALPLSFFDSRKTGEILSRMEDSQKVRQAISEAVVSVIMDILMLAVVGVALFFQSSQLFWIALATVPISSVMVWGFSKKFARGYRALMSESSEVQSYLVEAISGSGTVKAFNAESAVYREYEKRQLKAVKTGYTLGITRTLQTFFTGLLDGWSGNIIFWVGSYLILKDRFTVGQLFSFNALLVYFTGPLKRLLTLQPTLQEGAVAADRLGEIFDIAEEIPQDGKWITPASYHGFITADNITFRYGTRRSVLNGVSFTVNAGERVAFVGASGCGKTTLIKLLLKFYSPESGSLSIDQYNIEDVDTKHLRAHIGYVPQEVFLFSGTIAENIALHKPEASLEEIIEASIQTGVHSFVEQLPARYNTVLSERGMSLSGGERQRIALARALLSKPDILIFDEATSSLDTLSERHIHQVLESLKDKKRTTVMIAHRLSTVVHCDRIFVMDKGLIAESGTHTELLERGGLYYRLWNGETV